MINTTNINDIEVIIRNMLITQSQLDGKFVRNSLSLYGTGLNQEVGEDIFDSIVGEQCLILFELNARDSSFDVSETRNDKIKFYKAYNVHVIIYGDNSNTLANLLVGRIRSEKVRTTLAEQGVYYEAAEGIQTVYDFKNDVMWLRTDFDIRIVCEMLITQVTESEIFDGISQLNIIKEE